MTFCLLALQGKENVAINRGFLAKSAARFTPVYDERHRQIGVVAGGAELSHVTQRISLIAAAVLSGPFCLPATFWWGCRHVCAGQVLKRIPIWPRTYEDLSPVLNNAGDAAVNQRGVIAPWMIAAKSR